jgi:hypothetical protein
MIARLLDRFFLLIVSRAMLILLSLGVCVAMVPMLIEQFNFLRGGWAGRPTHEQIEDIEGLVDGLAGVLVAGGVFLESRETLRNMALRRKQEPDALEVSLNEIAHHNGMGLLLIGLFMEIGTALIGLPKHFLDTSGIERGIFAVCLALSAGAFIVMFDFGKDYVLTYFRTPTPHEDHT